MKVSNIIHSDNRAAQCHSERAADLQCQKPRCDPDYGAICMEFVLSSYGHVGFLWVL